DLVEQVLRGGFDRGLGEGEHDLLADLHFGLRDHDARRVGTTVGVLVAVLRLGLGRTQIGGSDDPVTVGVDRGAAVLRVRRQAIFFFVGALVKVADDAVAIGIRRLASVGRIRRQPVFLFVQALVGAVVGNAVAVGVRFRFDGYGL